MNNLPNRAGEEQSYYTLNYVRNTDLVNKDFLGQNSYDKVEEGRQPSINCISRDRVSKEGYTVHHIQSDKSKLEYIHYIEEGFSDHKFFKLNKALPFRLAGFPHFHIELLIFKGKEKYN